jgi:DNA-binding PadR family transcriptional regulator
MHGSTKIHEMLPLTPRVFLILWALADKPQHAYGLLAEVERRGSGQVTIKPGSLYEAIYSLEERGFVAEAVAETPSSDRRRGRTFGLTELGRAVLVAEAERLRVLVDELASTDLLSSQEPH